MIQWFIMHLLFRIQLPIPHTNFQWILSRFSEFRSERNNSACNFGAIVWFEWNTISIPWMSFYEAIIKCTLQMKNLSLAFMTSYHEKYLKHCIKALSIHFLDCDLCTPKHVVCRFSENIDIYHPSHGINTCIINEMLLLLCHATLLISIQIFQFSRRLILTWSVLRNAWLHQKSCIA